MWIRSQYNELINLENVGMIKREDNLLYVCCFGSDIMIAKYNNGYQAYQAIKIINKSIKNNEKIIECPKI